MRQFNKFKDTKGFIALWEYMIRFRYMITEQAQQRCRILAFWEKHGTPAATEAFKVSERTLFRWQSLLKDAGGKLDGLNRRSSAPNRRRMRKAPDDIKMAIINLRKERPRLGKEKIWKILSKYHGYQGSISTIGRILSDLKKANLIPKETKFSYYAKTDSFIEKRAKKAKKMRRPKEYAQCVEVDTIVRFVDGLKRYTLTAIDTKNKFGFAFTYLNHSSQSASDFLAKLKSVAPFEILSIQTDNGSEFMDHFKDACPNLSITQFHTYPRSPKMNARVERFNRTLDEEFIKYNRSTLRDDPITFNRKLIDYLVWYNTKRPHHSLNLLSPMEYIISKLPLTDCQMRWTNTFF